MSEELQCQGCGESVYDIDVRCKNCDMALSSTGAQRLIGSVVLEQYVITEILGQGGMSVVYEGKHKITGQDVALKVLPPDLAAHRDLKGRFLEEGKALAQLDHPNIVHLYNFGSDGDCLVLAMQYVRGITWERLIIDEEQVPWRKSAKLAAEVSGALDYAHSRGIIHRDMKPSNVLIRELDGAATVMDFGIAKVASSSKLTATGQTMGTVRYMSPEQVRGKTVGVETDIYSLAMTTYESLVGDTPFTGDTHFEIMTKHLNEIPVAPSKRGVALPPVLERALMRAMSKRPEDRQSSAKQFQDQLQAAMAISTEEVFSSSVEAATAPNRRSIESNTGLDDTALISGTEGVELATMHQGDAKKSSSTKKVLLGALVVAAAGGTLWGITRSQKEKVAKPKVATQEQHDAGQTKRLPPLQRPLAFRPQSAIDRTFEQDKLRVLASPEWSAERVRELVLQGRADYRDMAREQDWPQQSLKDLRVVIVSQSVLCNPLIYKPGPVNPSCADENAWLALHNTLYLVPTNPAKVMQARMSYWIAMMACVANDGPDGCLDVVQAKLDPL